MEANKEKIKAVRKPRQTVAQELELKTKVMRMVSNLLIGAEEKVYKLTQEAEGKTEELRTACVLLRAVDEKVEKLRSIVAEQKEEVERLRLLVKTYHSSADLPSNDVSPCPTAAGAL
jgi:hypothetical protein